MKLRNTPLLLLLPEAMKHLQYTNVAAAAAADVHQASSSWWDVLARHSSERTIVYEIRDIHKVLWLRRNRTHT